jgi:hypothetical protein
MSTQNDTPLLEELDRMINPGIYKEQGDTPAAVPSLPVSTSEPTEEAVSLLLDDLGLGKNAKDQSLRAAFEANAQVTAPGAPAVDAEKLQTLKQFLTRRLPQAPGYFAATKFAGAGRRGMTHYYCSDIDQLAERLLQLDKGSCDVYFGVAGYRQESVTVRRETRHRCQENVYSMKTLFLDIDVGDKKAAEGKGYATQEKALRGLGDFVAQRGLPQPTVVSSGTGLHVYWPLTEAVSPAQWLPVAKALGQVCKDAGLLVDPARTKDCASILRPPGCTNRKNLSNELPVVILQEGEAAASLDTISEALGVKVPAGAGAFFEQDGPDPIGLAPAERVIANSALNVPYELPGELQGLPADQGLAIVASAWKEIPDDELAGDYDEYLRLATAGAELIRELKYPQDKVVDLVWKHCSRVEGYKDVTRETVEGKIINCSLKGIKLTTLFQLAIRKGWDPRQALSVVRPAGAPPASGNVADYVRARLQRYKYLRGRDQFWDTEARVCVKLEAFNNSEMKYTSKLKGGAKDASRLVLANIPESDEYENLAFHPGQGAIFKYDDKKFLNNYRQPPAAGRMTKEQHWYLREARKRVFHNPEGRAFLGDYVTALAFLLSNPGTKIQHAKLLYGADTGTGKTTFMEHLPSLALGVHNSKRFTSDLLDATFNDICAEAHLLYLDELDADWDGSNKLKSWITSRMLPINPKGSKPYEIQNFLFFTAASNREAPVKLEGEDRRWDAYEVTRRPGTSETQDEAFWKGFYSVFPSKDEDAAPGYSVEQASAGLRGHLLRIAAKIKAVKTFNPGARPPRRDSKQQLIAASRSRAEQVLIERYNAEQFPFDRAVVPGEWVTQMLHADLGEKITPKRLAKILKGKPFDAEQLDQKQVNATRMVNLAGRLHTFEVNGRPRLWVLRDSADWKVRSPAVISAYLAGEPLAEAIAKHLAQKLVARVMAFKVKGTLLTAAQLLQLEEGLIKKVKEQSAGDPSSNDAEKYVKQHMEPFMDCYAKLCAAGVQLPNQPPSLH